MEQQLMMPYVKLVKLEWDKRVIIKEEIDIDWDEKDNSHEIKSDSPKTDSNLIKNNKVTLIEPSASTKKRKRNVTVRESQDANICNICGKYYTTSVSLKVHKKICGVEPKFQCDYCSFKTKTKKCVKYHIFRKHMDPVVSNKIRTFKKGTQLYSNCEKCNKVIKATNYKLHLFYCGRRSHLQCAHCPYKCKSKTSLTVHIHRQHAGGSDTPSTKINATGIKRYCQNCDRTQEHHRSIKDCQKCFSTLLFQCTTCKKVFDKRQTASYHWKSRCGLSGYYHCPSCDYKSVRRATITEHSKRDHPDSNMDGLIHWKSLFDEAGSEESTLFKCSNCDKRVINSHNLKMHMKVCLGAEKKETHSTSISFSEPTRCSRCQKNFKHVTLLNRHRKTCEKNQYATRITKDSDDEVIEVVEDYAPLKLYSLDEIRKDFENMVVRCCGVCGEEKEFHENSISINRNICPKCNVTLRFKCKKCQKDFANKSSINTHVKSVCYPDEEFKCIKCEFKSVSSFRVNEHYKSIHDTDSADCNICGKKFKNMKYMKHHQWQCGAKPKFKCGHCRFKTKTKTYLREHIFRKHMETKVIDRVQSFKIACQRFARTLIPLKACCLDCKKEQRLHDRMKTCIMCKNKLHFKCKTCKNKFTADDENACEHVKDYLEMIKYECERCGRGAMTKKGMITHKSRCGKSIPCRFCKYSSNDRGTIKKHEERKHPLRV